MPAFDFSTPGAEKVTLIVRPFNHIGDACAGDEVTLDASELAQAPVADALWTRAEMEAAEKEADATRRARMRSPTDEAARVVNDGMKKAVAERAKNKERAKAEAVAKARDMAEALKSLSG